MPQMSNLRAGSLEYLPPNPEGDIGRKRQRIQRPLPFPPEVLERIFRLLSHYPGIDYGIFHHHQIHSNLLSCSQVSHQWRSLALPLIWCRLDFWRDEEATRSETLKRLASFLINSHSRAVETGVDHLAFVKRIDLRAPTLRALDGPRLPAADLAEVALGITNILQLLSPNQIREIEFYLPEWYSSQPNVFSNFFKTVVPLMGNLMALRFTGLSYSGDDGAKFFQQLPDTLEKISLNGGIGGEVPFPLDGIYALPKLSKIQLSRLDNITSPQLQQGVRNCGARLRELTIVHCRLLFNDLILETIADHCPNLTTLRLNVEIGTLRPTVQQITEHNLCHVIDSCQYLTLLELSGISVLTNAFLAHCASNARRLRYLTIRNAFAELSGQGVRDVSGWQFLTDIFITRPTFVDARRNFISNYDPLSDSCQTVNLGPFRWALMMCYAAHLGRGSINAFQSHALPLSQHPSLCSCVAASRLCRFFLIESLSPSSVSGLNRSPAKEHVNQHRKEGGMGLTERREELTICLVVVVRSHALNNIFGQYGGDLVGVYKFLLRAVELCAQP
ncbi:hypothetical protein BC936DRAFT_146817 [Jimgerdemannia flammicorona]|uniref:F-box domain-containing protein n=1 Tax=Jimgerdemannia flammicorona TaxID=994334 RepID=A0A433D6T4_9FUNG|nr:hypothetical protein BC936DRAFT_146817 [Jimgerdemannia flammicorona]